MKIVAISIRGQEFLYQPQSAHRAPKPSAILCRQTVDKPARNHCMDDVARNAMNLLKLIHPNRDIAISYSKVNDESVERFSEWQRERFHILTGDEYFFIWNRSPDWDTDEPDLLYVVIVTGDSVLTAAAELMNLIAKKF